MTTTAFTTLLGEHLLSKDKKPVATDDAFANADVIGLYFSAHWCPPCRGFTPKLADTYTKMREDGKAFEIVFVSSDRDESQFKSYFQEMPWLSLPFEERDTKAALSKKFKVRGIPSLVLLDKQGNVISTDGRSKVQSPEDFPWAPKPLSELLGETFVSNKDGSVSNEAIAGKTLGLYFSAHWCPPCRSFTPKLIETYNKLKEEDKDFEVIFCSSDKDEEAFNEYYKDMPWLALPFADRKRKDQLSDHFEVGGIPTLVMISAEGEVISTKARGAVGADPEGKDFPWAPKACNDLATDGADGINDTTSLILLMEKAEAGAQAAAEEMLYTLAEKDIAAAKAKGTDSMCYFTAKSGGGVVDQIRKLCSLGEPVEGEVQMILLDIPDQGGFYVHKQSKGSGAITAESICEFLAAYQSKTLERKQLS